MKDTTIRHRAARLTQALNLRHIPLTAHRRYETFCAEVAAEAGLDVLDGIVAQVSQHADLSRGAA